MTEVICEDLFWRLAESDQNRLAELIASDQLGPTDLTFAAEAMGHVAANGLAMRALESLITHPSVLVREGVVYGLAACCCGTALAKMAAEDPSPTIRKLAGEEISG